MSSAAPSLRSYTRRRAGLCKCRRGCSFSRNVFIDRIAPRAGLIRAGMMLRFDVIAEGLFAGLRDVDLVFWIL